MERRISWQVIFISGILSMTKSWDYPTKSDAFVDLGFAIDRHQSINETQFTQLLNFVAEFIPEIRIEETNSRGGLASFDQISTLDVQLDDHDNTLDLQTDIKLQKYAGYGRDISLGYFRLREDMFLDRKGDRSDVGNVAVLITNGYSDPDWAIHEASLLSRESVAIINIGIGNDNDMKNLLTAISGENTLFVADFPSLPIIKDSLRTLVQRAVVPQLYEAVDVCMVVDCDISISPTDWDMVLEYLTELAWMVDIDRQDSTFGLVTFSATGNLDIQLNANSDFASLKTAIMGVTNGGTGHMIEEGLRTAREECFTQDNGDRPDVPNVLILVTNGQSQYDLVEQEAALLEANGTKIMTIGVGAGVNQTLMESIATRTGTELNAYSVADFTELKNEPNMTVSNMCLNPPPTPTPPPTTPTPPTTPAPTKDPLGRGVVVDLGYCIDRHRSITLPDWNFMLNYTAGFAHYVEIQSGNQVGLVSFDTVATVDISLNKHQSLVPLQADLLDEAYAGGTVRDISKCLQTLRTQLFTADEGDDPLRLNIAFIITNGESDPVQAKEEAKMFVDTGALLFAIGIGTGVTKSFLVDLCQDEQNVFMIQDFSHFGDLNETLLPRFYELTIPAEELNDSNKLTIILCCILIPSAIIIITVAGFFIYKKHKAKKNGRVSASNDNLQKNDPNHMDKGKGFAPKQDHHMNGMNGPAEGVYEVLDQPGAQSSKPPTRDMYSNSRTATPTGVHLSTSHF